MRVLYKFLSHQLVICAVLLVGFGLYYGNAALNFPVLFNIDNVDNYAATRYLSEHHKLPVVAAGDKDILFTEIGTTRSLRPPFTYIVSAVMANATKGLISDRTARQRLGSPLIAATALVVMFIGLSLVFSGRALPLTGVVVIGLMPKFVYLASCNNDDIGAILSVSLLFSSLLALIKYRCKPMVLLALAFSVGLLFQTKFTAWLTLPWFAVFCTLLLRPYWLKVAKMMPLLLIVCIAGGGWWLIFNMTAYGVDDPTAFKHAVELQRTLSDLEPNRQGYRQAGVGWVDLLSNHDQFLTKTYKSFIGYLEWLKLEVSLAQYWFYGVIFFIGLASAVFRSPSSPPAYLDWLVVLMFVSQCVFYLHHNLVRDVQPQARYILPLIMPMMYLFLRALERVPGVVLTTSHRGRQATFQFSVSVAIILASFVLHKVTLNDYIEPSYIAKPFYTRLEPPLRLSAKAGLPVVSASGLSYQFDNSVLELRRTDLADSSLSLAPEFCKRLPVNALISITITSPTTGGLYLRLDRHGRGAYEDSYWSEFGAGQSSATFSVRGKNCTGAQITLPKGTHRLTVQELEIRELRIHEHGEPILK